VDVTERIDVRLSAALLTGTDAALESWASTGRPGLLLLREYLAGTWEQPPAPGVHERDVLDNTAAAVAAIAAANPDAFLEVFAGDAFDANSFVLDGMGQIDDPRATERLARATESKDWGRRMHAAIGLGRRSSSLATGALGRLLRDDDDLVRHHALRSLARIGDASVLPLLRDLTPRSSREADLTDEAVASIVERATNANPNG
jgi:HEAT repeat protein